MKYSTSRHIGQLVPVALLGTGSYLAYAELGPAMDGVTVVSWPAAIAAGMGVISAAAGLSSSCALIAAMLETAETFIPRGKGTAKWARWKDLKKDILHAGWGPYWGTYAHGFINRGKPIFAEHTAPAAIFGNTGSGKDIRHVIPNIMTIPHSKFIPDFKFATCHMVKDALEERGETVHVVDVGGKGKGKFTDAYNLLETLIDGFATPGGLMDVDADALELAEQLYPKPDGGSSEDPFWRESTHDVLKMSFIQPILFHGLKGNLGHSNQLVGNRLAFLQEMQWVCGQLKDKDGNLQPAMPIEDGPWVELHDPDEVERFIEKYRSDAAELVDLFSGDQGNMDKALLRGTKNALKPFSPASRAYKAISHSTFRFSDMRKGDKAVNVIVALDSSRLKQQSKINAALQWAAKKEWERHENQHVPVHLIGNEITNSKLDELPSFLTWAREYNIIISLYIQSPDAFRLAYGDKAFGTLLSEAEIKLFLPGQRSLEIQELIETLLGEESYTSKSYNGNYDEFGLQGFGYQEDVKPLMSKREISETDKGILFFKNHAPTAVNLPVYAAIDPIRDQIADNPFYGKPFLQKVKLRLGDRKGSIFYRLSQLFKKGGRS